MNTKVWIGGVVAALVSSGVATVVVTSNPSYVPGTDTPTEFVIDELQQQEGETAGNWINKRLDWLQRQRMCNRAGRGGCRVKFRCGTRYTTNEPIVLCRSMHLLGCGAGAGGSGSTGIKQLNASAPSVIKIPFADECRASKAAGGYEMADGDGSWSILEGLEIEGAGLPQIDHINKPQWGVQADGIPILRDVRIQQTTIGVRCHATAKPVGGGFRSNCNLARLDNVQIYYSAGPGLLLDGPDSNAGMISALNVTYACNRASPALIAALKINTCAAVYDSNFLGNTYLAPHTAASYWDYQSTPKIAAVSAGTVTEHRVINGGFERRATFTASVGHGFEDGDWVHGGTTMSCFSKYRPLVTSVTPITITIRDSPKECPLGVMTDGEGTLTAIRRYFPGYYFDPIQQVSHNVILGAYAEEDQTVSTMNTASVVLGGLSHWKGTGTRLVAGRMNRLTVVNSKDTNKLGWLALGDDCNYPGCVLGMEPSYSTPGAYPIRWVIDPVAKRFHLNVAAMVNPLSVSLTRADALGLGSILLRKPTFVKDAKTYVKTTTVAQ